MMGKFKNWYSYALSKLRGIAVSYLNRNVFLGRQSVAHIYLKGEGIEIGALHSPLKVPPGARVKYVDRMPLSDLRKQYPELNERELVNVDIISDGEYLENIRESSLDFVIANHFIEHCQNPFGAIQSMLRVLKKGGIVYLSIPDKRYTFDRQRPVTTLAHLLRDFREGPDWSRQGHLEEWTKIVGKLQGAEAENYLRWLNDTKYSIHYHVWTQGEILEFIAALKGVLNVSFEVELLMKNEGELLCVLRKEV